MTNYKLMPEVPTDAYIAKLAKLWGYTFEEASSTYDLMYDSAPQVECEPVAWQYFEEYPDSTNKWWNAEEGDDKDAISECHPVRDLYTIPQDQSAKIAELEADKQKLIEALEKFQPLTDNLGWIALIWNDHNFTNTTMLNKLKDAFGALGFNRGQDVKHINKFRDDLEALLSKMKGE
jgi:hypothetical protein